MLVPAGRAFQKCSTFRPQATTQARSSTLHTLPSAHAYLCTLKLTPAALCTSPTPLQNWPPTYPLHSRTGPMGLQRNKTRGSRHREQKAAGVKKTRLTLLSFLTFFFSASVSLSGIFLSSALPIVFVVVRSNEIVLAIPSSGGIFLFF